MIFEHIISTIAPFTCLGCKIEGVIVCSACQAKLPSVKPQRSSCGTTPYATATLYVDVAKDVIHLLKFGRARAAADCIAQIMTDRIALPHKNYVVTHVPTANSRIRQRGYDQAQQIAKRFAKQNVLPYVPLLARQNTTRQVGANKQARQAQAASMFRLRRTAYAQNTAVLLIDDVITTGATMRAAMQALRAAGASEVYAIAFARAE